MTYEIDFVYEIGNRKQNEDAYVINQESGIYSVIDGATGLGGLEGMVASEIMRISLATASPTQPLLSGVLKGNALLGEKVLDITKHEVDELPKENRSSCGLAAIKIINHEQMEYVHAGDCMLFIQYEDQTIRAITYDHVSSLDAIAIRRLEMEWAKFHTDQEDPNAWGSEKLKEHFQKIKENLLPLLLENRRKLNSKNGYSIIDGSRVAAHYLEHGVIFLHNVKRILMLTDGLQVPNMKSMGQEAWLESASIAFEQELKGLFTHVRELEDKDPACIQFPRLKDADDKTGILINLI